MKPIIAAIGSWLIPFGVVALAYLWSYHNDPVAGLACMGGLWLAGALMVWEALK